MLLTACGAQTELDVSAGPGPSTPETIDTSSQAGGYRWQQSDAFSTFAAPPRAEISPDNRYVVRLGSSGSQAIERVGGEVLYELDAGLVATRLDPSQLESLQESGAVDGVEVDPRRYLLGEAEQVPYGVEMVQAAQVTDTSTLSKRIKVCVIDSGYSMAHEDLPGDVSGTADSGTGAWDIDGCGHGTHVAGTIAALRNNLGVVGVAPEAVQLHIIKAFDDNCAWTYSSILVRAVYECIEVGSNIISMSLGGSSPYWFEQLAFEWAELRGVLSVAAAGNRGDTTKSYPASYDEVISVAAVDADSQLAAFSQRNDQVELAAPGVAVLSTVPTADGGGYATFSGTSMATPHVSAVAALVWSRHPNFSNRRVRRALQQSAFDLWPQGRDESTGFGLVQAGGALGNLTDASDTEAAPGDGSTLDCSLCSCGSTDG